MTTITIDRATVEQALEALEAMQSYAAAERKGLRICDEAIPALRAALAQQAEPVQEQAEPVPGAWVASPDGRVIYDDVSADDGLLRVSGDFENDEQRIRYAQRIVDKLNAALAQQAEPAQAQRCRAEPRSDGDYACDCKIGACPGRSAEPAQQAEPLNLSDRAVQRRLAAQWGYVPAAQAEPVEPVAWNWMLDGLPYGRACYGDPPDADLAERAATAGRTVRLLYTAPPQRKPLPKHDQHCVDVPGYGLTAVRLVRAVERAHGIKE